MYVVSSRITITTPAPSLRLASSWISTALCLDSSRCFLADYKRVLAEEAAKAAEAKRAEVQSAGRLRA